MLLLTLRSLEVCPMTRFAVMAMPDLHFLVSIVLKFQAGFNIPNGIVHCILGDLVGREN